MQTLLSNLFFELGCFSIWLLETFGKDDLDERPYWFEYSLFQSYQWCMKTSDQIKPWSEEN
jgi:hypothetical protein